MENSILMSPAMIVEGKGNSDFNHKRITFVSYYIVYTGTKNDMKRRSVSAITLNESNDHGGHYFMSIYTGKRLQSYQWIELPIDDEVISQVRDVALEEDANKMTDNDPMFEWEPSVLTTEDVRE